MSRDIKRQRTDRLVLIIYVLGVVVLLKTAFIEGTSWYWLLVIALPLILIINKISLNQSIMNNNNPANPVVLPESDFQILKRLASGQQSKTSDMSLAHEVERAIVVKDDAFPPNTIRINSKVTVQNLDTDEITSFSLVLPQHADIRQKKISILAPMSAALIGFRAGDVVSWQMPSGLKNLKVLDVSNDKIVLPVGA